MARPTFSVPHVLVIRHGLTEWNAAGRWQGWADVPLTDAGRAQAVAAAVRLTEEPLRFERVVFSDLVRSAETAHLMADALAINERVADADWRERDIGEWSGKLTDEILRKWPGQLEAWRDGLLDRVPGGEFEAALRDRITTALERVVVDARPALVVTHGGVIRTLDRIHGVEPRPVANVGGRWFGASSGGRIVAGHVVDLLGGPRPTSVVL